MSDFDKEAEREKLRKKYARDETKRANTQRMSELLLKGATMTNAHCNQCGDPLFRHNGQTFCARCQADAAQQTESGENSEIDKNASGTDSSQADTVDPEAAKPATAEQRADSAAESTTELGGMERVAGTDQPSGASQAELSSQAAPTGDLSAARDSLIQTVTRFAQQAAATEDPRRARELLSAAREAAETLDALD